MKYFDLGLEELLKSIPNPNEGEGEDNALSKAVGDAVKEKGDEAPDDDDDDQDDNEESGDEDSDDDDESDEDGDGEEDSAAEQATALNLYKALKNPATAKTMMASLMAQMGITADSTKKEVTEAKAVLEDELKEILGDDYKFLADKIAKSVQLAVKRLTAEAIKPLEESQANMMQAQRQRDVDSALERLDNEFDVPKKLANGVLRLMQDHPHNGSQDYYKYVKGLLALASAELDIPLTKKGASGERAARRNRNRNEANLPAASSGSGRKVRTANSLDDAINMAVASIKDKGRG